MRFRRRPPAVDDGLSSDAEARVLLKAASKRNLALERQVAVLTSALNRSDGSHRMFCTHAAKLVDVEHSLAEAQRLLGETRRSEELMFQRLRRHLASLQHVNATTQVIPVVAAIDEQEPR